MKLKEALAQAVSGYLTQEAYLFLLRDAQKQIAQSMGQNQSQGRSRT
jgi:hypothetical protein